MQILVKSPPPLTNTSTNQVPANSLLKKASPRVKDSGEVLSATKQGEPNEVTNGQVLAAREAHILKLNTQNVKLQEENDNLVNEYERLKFEMQEKFVPLQRDQSELNGKLEKSNIEKEHFKKVCVKTA